MTKIKICGLMREEDVFCLNEQLPDLAGFIFAKGRRRYIPPETAKRFREMLVPEIKTVGVFVDESELMICEIAQKGIIDYVQLHGQEDESFIRKIKEGTGLPVIKAFRVKTPDDVRKAASSCADMILLDNGAGGTGEMFDHGLLEAADRPYILAGGLAPGNIADIVRKYSPYGVDASSGVETDGKKDPEKIKSFIKAVKSAVQ